MTDNVPESNNFNVFFVIVSYSIGWVVHLNCLHNRWSHHTPTAGSRTLCCHTETGMMNTSVLRDSGWLLGIQKVWNNFNKNFKQSNSFGPAYSRHVDSSEKSKQSGRPSHRRASGIQCPDVHWNVPGRQVSKSRMTRNAFEFSSSQILTG